MLLQHRLVAVVGYGVEIKVNDALIVDAQLVRVAYKGFLKPVYMFLV